MFRRPNKPLPVLWAVPICVGIVELFPAASPVTIAVDGLHIWDKLPHFCVYLALSCLSAIGFRDWRRGTIAGLSMFVLGLLLESGQHLSPGRSVDIGDVIANGAGAVSGVLKAISTRILL